MNRIHALLFTLLIFINVLSIPKDTIPPTVKWISPIDFTVFTTNTIRLAAEVADNPGGSGIAKVVFSAWTTGRTAKKDIPLKIAEVFTPPYETTLECFDLPDHDNTGKLVLHCEAIDKAGNSSGIVTKTNFVIDRNPDFKTITVNSEFTGKKIKIDGFLDEWKSADSLSFMNNDNKIMLKTFWDKQNLYLGIRVFDKSIISHFVRSDLSSLKGDNSLWTEDELEIFFNPLYKHQEYRDTTYAQFLFSACGYLVRVAYNSLEYAKMESLYSTTWQTRFEGTPNLEQDQDTGYTIECAIPWKILGVKPAEGLNMGFEVWNCDKDYVSGDYFYSSWSGVGVTNLWNPSEWGNLKLSGGSNKNIWLGIILGAAILAVAGYGYFYYKRKRQISPKPLDFLQTLKAEEIPLDGERLIFKEALEYINEHYKKNISLEDVVKAAKTNVTSFSKIFKENTRLTFVQYLTEVRMERAKYLLKNSKLTVTEIAEETGFGNADYFGTVFKKRENISPLQYRKL